MFGELAHYGSEPYLSASMEGIVVGPEGGATAAAARKLIASGILSPDDHVLLLNTGSGLKTPEWMGNGTDGGAAA